MFPGTWLYCPGDRPAVVAKALRSGAAAVVVDLQDAVAPDRKDEARRSLLRLLATRGGTGERGPELHVRINAVTGDHGRADAEALAASGLSDRVEVVRLPKVATPWDVAHARELLGEDSNIHVLIETAEGVENARDIAAAQGVVAVSLGEGDLGAELGISDESGFDWVRSRLVVAAAAAGLPAPSMSVYPRISDEEGLLRSCRRGLRLGMRGRSAVHPSQLPVISRAFAPREAEVRRARRIVDSAATASGAFRMDDGTFVDAPVVLAARRIVEWNAQLTASRKEQT